MKNPAIRRHLTLKEWICKYIGCNYDIFEIRIFEVMGVGPAHKEVEAVAICSRCGNKKAKGIEIL